jgi:hypothetical protein
VRSNKSHFRIALSSTPRPDDRPWVICLTEYSEATHELVGRIGFSTSTKADSIVGKTTTVEALVKLDITTGTLGNGLVVASVVWGMKVGEGDQGEE